MHSTALDKMPPALSRTSNTKPLAPWSMSWCKALSKSEGVLLLKELMRI